MISPNEYSEGEYGKRDYEYFRTHPGEARDIYEMLNNGEYAEGYTLDEISIAESMFW